MAKLVFKTHAFPTPSETFVVNNVVEAIKKGLEVTIITNRKYSSSQSSQQELLNLYDIAALTLQYTEPKGKKNRIVKALLLLFNPLIFLYYIRYLKLKKSKTLSLVFRLAFYYSHTETTFHVHFANACEPLLELKKIGYLKSKIIVTFHGYDAYYLPTGKELKNLVNDFEAYVEHITVNSAYLKQMLVSKGFPASKIVIIPIGIDSTFFKPLPTEEDTKPQIKLITVARLVELKGIDYGIRVVQILIEKGYDVIYTIVGDGPEKERLEVMCIDLDIEKRVRFLGKKSQTEIKNLLGENNLFLMTSTIDKYGRREAFGAVSLEAQAMELPVIGFKSGGFPETVIDGNTAILVEDKNINSMAEAVESLINDKKLINSMSKGARTHVLESFSFEKTTKRYLDLY